MEQTPITILQKEIRFYNAFIHKIKTRDGIVSEGLEVDAKLEKLELQLSETIKIFQRAIELLSSEQNAEGCDATEDHSSNADGKQKN